MREFMVSLYNPNRVIRVCERSVSLNSSVLRMCWRGYLCFTINISLSGNVRDIYYEHKQKASYPSFITLRIIISLSFLFYFLSNTDRMSLQIQNYWSLNEFKPILHLLLLLLLLWSSVILKITFFLNILTTVLYREGIWKSIQIETTFS